MAVASDLVAVDRGAPLAQTGRSPTPCTRSNGAIVGAEVLKLEAGKRVTLAVASADPVAGYFDSFAGDAAPVAFRSNEHQRALEARLPQGGVRLLTGRNVVFLTEATVDRYFALATGGTAKLRLIETPADRDKRYPWASLD